MGCCQPIRSDQSEFLPSAKRRNRKTLNITPGDFVTTNTEPITNFYTFQGLIGNGGFSEVRKALHKQTNTFRAVKSISINSSSESEISKLLKEVSILKRLDHPGILHIFEVFQSPTNLSIVTELCTGGELFDRIKELKKFSENQAAQCMLELVNAVMYCHSQGVVHRDLKPENVLYESKDGSRLKIIDFGMSQICNNRQKMKKLAGTYFYMAPEVITGEYTEKCDIWSLGIILYILLCGIPPFGGSSDEEVASKILNSPLSFEHPNWRSVSQEAKTLVMNMLKKNPEQRISIQEIFSDSWLQSRGNGVVPDREIESSTLQALASFRAESHLQRAVYAFIVTQMMDSEGVKELREVFVAIDKNGDGVLSVEEVKEAVKKFHFKFDVEEIVQQCDSDMNGFINYSEFLMATVDRAKVYSKERIREVFNIFDKNQDGKIDLNELRMMLGGDRNCESALLKIIKETDTNGDGEIDFDEFLEHVAAC